LEDEANICEPGCCPPAAPAAPIDDARDEQLARLARALGHPARVAIMRLLIRRDACICGEIVDELPLAQSTVSQHLKQLKEAGLIRGEIDGPRVCYCVEPAALAQLKALIAAL
jgi:ArsR family transcriptional regulator